MERILAMWYHADVVYKGRAVGEQLPDGYVIKSVLKPTSSVGASQQCYYAVKGDTGILACSGSNDKYDWVSNFLIVRASWPELGRGTDASFHYGTLDMFKTSVKPWLDTLKLASKLIITGHSAGGMTAQAVALYLHYAKRRSSGLELYVFGAPFIGDPAAAKLMEDTRIPAVTVAVDGDSVPTANRPFTISGYAPWGAASASATQRSIVIFGATASSRIGYRYAQPSYALPTPTSFALHLAYGTVLANIIAASKAQRCTYNLWSSKFDKFGQCVGTALCMNSVVASAVPERCGSVGYCNPSNSCYK
jgi:hypothetical protein